MKAYLNRHRWLVIALFVLGAVATVIMVRWLLELKKAHSTFEDYYAFRGCTDLLERGDGYGVCRTRTGGVIRIVQYQGRWFLDGDLPCKTGICW